VETEVAANLDAIYNEILAMLDAMAANPEQWTRR
jgi:hypothetical protein